MYFIDQSVFEQILKNSGALCIDIDACHNKQKQHYDHNNNQTMKANKRGQQYKYRQFQNQYQYNPTNGEQQRRRIKTQSNSQNTSVKLTPMDDKIVKYSRVPSRLPSVYDNDTTQQSKMNLNRINEDDNDQPHTGARSFNKNQTEKKSRAKTLINSYHQKKSIENAQKIFESLCLDRRNNSIILVDTHSIKLAKPQIQAYQHVRNIYQGLVAEEKQKEIQSLLDFINQLKRMNIFFTKIDDILSLVLFKKGKVHQYSQKQLIYYQNQPKQSFMIVLWGEIKLKEIYRNKVKYLIPGDFLCQEVVVNDKKKSHLFGQIGFIKGHYITQQTAKCQTKCGLLQITKDNYQQIKKKFAQNCQKDKVFIFQKILIWSLSKKARFRK